MIELKAFDQNGFSQGTCTGGSGELWHYYIRAVAPEYPWRVRYMAAVWQVETPGGKIVNMKHSDECVRPDAATRWIENTLGIVRIP